MKTKHLLLTITLLFIATLLPSISLSQVIAAGSSHSLSICNDGTVMAWGANGNGQLGDGTNTSKSTPVQVSGLTGITAIAASGNHSLALKNDGTVWAWGANSSGQLGDGTTTNKNIPLQVSGLTDIIAIAGGGTHSLAIKNDGTVWAWGANSSGQLGDGTTTNKNIPVLVSGLTDIIAIAGGAIFSLALKNDGTVWAWGWNNSGQLGDGTNGINAGKNTPVQVIGLSGIAGIACGQSHSLALKNDSTIWAWGDNGFGTLGDGTNVNKNTPVQVSALTNIIAIRGGGAYSMALHNNGTAWAWGDNFNGQIGDGTSGLSKSTPVQVSGLTDITAIAASGNHSLALNNDGTVWAWGANFSGQLGDGTTTNVNTPAQVTSLCIMTEIKDMDEEFSLSVFPNPGSGKFIIEHDNTYRNMRLVVYDILGMPVKTGGLQDIQDPTSEIDLSSQPNGVYFLSISSDEGRKTIRVLKL